MDEAFVRQNLLQRMRTYRVSVEQAAADMARGFGLDPAVFVPVVDIIKEQARQNRLLDSPPGVRLEREANLRDSSWYAGSAEGDVFWPRLRAKMESGGLRDVVDEIDPASRKVVGELADPSIHSLKKKGLVLGYVQSGKTANFTAVMAKSADAGYRLFIVLSGLHNNLRRQTQVRLESDLSIEHWLVWTSPEADFGGERGGAAVLAGDLPSLAVVKKNEKRLRNLIAWLRAIPEDIRRRTPILLLDDEADQATPNSPRAAERLSAINELVRELWKVIPTGTYLGYTATPFANIFMDPNDDEELYPADFILDLPRPDAYYGAERVFGREPIDDDDDPDPGLDMLRTIDDDEAAALRPQSRADRSTFDPGPPESLQEAVAWFIVATAIRHARGQENGHSSMLVHTTHYTDPHFAMKARIDALLQKWKADLDAGDTSPFHTSYDDEATRVADEATQPLPPWDEVANRLADILCGIRVVVDNAKSFDRLDYGRTEDGQPVVETVIAIGGGTLSRGLTLEGLTVSYFTRTSQTYDTLLQMGRWFGYRPGYEDLPRMWMQNSLAAEYRFLALVEEEIRGEIRHLMREGLTPRQFGIRVRAHPGRLAIVSRNKMRHAETERISYSGERLQNFIFEEDNKSVPGTGIGALDHNLDVARRFITHCGRLSTPEAGTGRRPRWLFRDIPATDVVRLIREFHIPADQSTMQKDHMTGWIERAAADRPWNVVVLGSSRQSERVTLGSVDLGLDRMVPAFNRAPLVKSGSGPGTANVKALMSKSDWVLDLDPQEIEKSGVNPAEDPREVRRQLAEGRGLLVIYPVSRRSVPLGAQQAAKNRRAMRAEQDIIGLGLIFPDVEREGFASDATFFAVRPDWEMSAAEDDEEESLFEDTEATLVDPKSGQDVSG